MRDWYYPGDNYGAEFPYPKHLQQVAMVTTTALRWLPLLRQRRRFARDSGPAEAENQPPAEQPEQQPEVAQNTAPPAPETPAQSTPEQPAQLPKTGSPYPTIGVLGGLLLFAGGLLRLKRHA